MSVMPCVVIGVLILLVIGSINVLFKEFKARRDWRNRYAKVQKIKKRA